jgi:hypothetical protein
MSNTIELQAGQILLPTDLSNVHPTYSKYYDGLDEVQRLPIGSRVVCDGVNFIKVLIGSEFYAISRYYRDWISDAIDEEGNTVKFVRDEYSITTAYDKHGNRKYFISEKAAENANYKFSLRMGAFCSSDDKERLYGNEKCLDYHTHARLSSQFAKKLPNFVTEEDEHIIGLEVEKVDSRLRNDSEAWEILQNTGWVREQDGSLTDSRSAGYELVSPLLPLFDNARLDKAFEPVLKYINANSDKSCGGHINVSRKGKTSEELLDEMKHIAPIFYALYERRLTNTYCKAKKWGYYFRYPEKYQAFCLKSDKNVVEIRLFPRVKNIDTLKWRIKLLQLLIPTGTKQRNLNQICALIGCTETPLYKLFAEHYSHAEIGQKLRDIDKYSKQFATHRNGISASVKRRINATMGFDVFDNIKDEVITEEGQ